MKTIKLLILLAASFLLIGCTPDEPECVCKTASMVLKEKPTKVFYYTNLPIDCVTGEPLIDLPSNYWYINCE
jgi:uncharacterized protein YcfL